MYLYICIYIYINIYKYVYIYIYIYILTCNYLLSERNYIAHFYRGKDVTFEIKLPIFCTRQRSVMYHRDIIIIAIWSDGVI